MPHMILSSFQRFACTLHQGWHFWTIRITIDFLLLLSSTDRLLDFSVYFVLFMFVLYIISGSKAQVLHTHTHPKNMKPKLTILLDQTVFVAAGRLSGLVQLHVDDGSYDAIALDISLRVAEVNQDADSKQLHEAVWNQQAIPIWRTADGRTSYAFRRGTHSFPFAFQIPDGMPASVDESLSRRHRMSFTLNAAMFHASMAQYNLTATRNARVVENLSPVLQQVVMTPATAEGKKRLFMGGDRDLSMVVRTNKSIFAAGEPVYVAVDVSNDSKKRIRGVRAEVVQTVKDLVGSKIKTKTKSLSKFEFLQDDFEVLPRSHRQLVVDVPTPLDACSSVLTTTFTIDYSLVVELDVPWAKNLQVVVPIRITPSASYNTIFFPTVEQTSRPDIGAVPAETAGDAEQTFVYEAYPAKVAV
jgi:hypothetical protein